MEVLLEVNAVEVVGKGDVRLMMWLYDGRMIGLMRVYYYLIGYGVIFLIKACFTYFYMQSNPDVILEIMKATELILVVDFILIKALKLRQWTIINFIVCFTLLLLTNPFLYVQYSIWLTNGEYPSILLHLLHNYKIIVLSLMISSSIIMILRNLKGRFFSDK